jgi:hypothetical protein
MLSFRPAIHARLIDDTDMHAVVDLLTKGFPLSNRHYWRRALETLSVHPTPVGLPQYGHLLESDGVVVGVILLIFSSILVGDRLRTRCNISSWYVEPAFRGHAALLVSRAIKYKNVTYMNISPAKHTRRIIEVQGFARYSTGQFVAVPALSKMHSDGKAKVIGVGTRPGVYFESAELDLLTAHETHGCLSLWCTTSARAYPFVFLPRLVKGFIPCTQLIYCRDIKEFVRFAGVIGRYLAVRGKPLVIVDSNGPISGLVGKYVDDKMPKYFKGPDRPSFGDLAYTEAVMF